MNIQERLGIPGIQESRVPVRSKQLEYVTAGSGDSIGEADGTFSAAGRDNKSEKDLHLVTVLKGYLGDVGCGEGGVREFILDHDGDRWPDNGLAAK